MELYKKYRPKDFSDVVGQDAVVSQLQNLIEKNRVPHAILLCGPKGTGKTTISRILRRKLNCSKWDFREVNCANQRGIDFIRTLERESNLSPMKGDSKIWVLDECHMLTGEASNAFLKILEDTPQHVFFILATTDPQKIISTVRSRCTEFAVQPFNAASLRKLIQKICKAEKIKLTDDVCDAIISNSDGAARNCLVLLDKVVGLGDEEEQLDAITKSSIETAGIEIARALFNPRIKWPEMSVILKKADLTDAEGLRWLILAYAKSILLGGGKMSSRAFQVIQIFRDNWFDSKASGLVACCYEIVTGG